MKHACVRLIAAFLALILLNGCVPDRVYRKQVSVTTVPPRPTDLPADSPNLPSGTRCPQMDPKYTGPYVKLTPLHDGTPTPVEHPTGPCLAFIEFNDKGDAAVPGTLGEPGQLSRAKALIEKAIADDPQRQPVILTFIHGWKHNASPGPPDDANIQGFEEVLDRLYRAYYGGSDCSGNTASCKPGHVVVGIYIGWRGEIISKYWPVARTVTVYNRESAATHVGNGNVVGALKVISQTAHFPARPASQISRC